MTRIGPVTVTAEFSGQTYTLGKMIPDEHDSPDQVLRDTAEPLRKCAQTLEKGNQRGLRSV